MQLNQPARTTARRESLAERIHSQLKEDILSFRLLPGDRFSESEIAERMDASRTPVRQALYQLEREGYLEVRFRSGWQVRAFDFARFEELYELRIVLEMEAVRRLCTGDSGPVAHEVLTELHDLWAVPPAQRHTEGDHVFMLDERFHCQLVEAAGNSEMTRLHADICERIRVIRKLDFERAERLEKTYQEHAMILQQINAGNLQAAQQLLLEHIEASKAEVRKVTLHMLQQARQQALQGPETAMLS
ncbi:GntR family transcriptional regulator [Halopseudomonas oceani]|uniref:GntR family transcriptional regulator n=1 Tax=Halopseudomonas oceani TaxID=1708783 RepID=UPI002AA70426|nr:GntR family transcriptional regulator [Halopseudomonas oceani]